MATPEAPKQLESQESIPSNLNPTFDETFRALDESEQVDSESTDLQQNEVVDPIPEMSMDEIMSLSDDYMRWLLKDLLNPTINNHHKDKKWFYMIVKGKKVYEYEDPHGPKDNNTPYFYIEAHESASNIESVAIFKKDWDKFKWVYRDLNGIYKWSLDSSLKPKNDDEMVFSSL